MQYAAIRPGSGVSALAVPAGVGTHGVRHAEGAPNYIGGELLPARGVRGWTSPGPRHERTRRSRLRRERRPARRKPPRAPSRLNAPPPPPSAHACSISMNTIRQRLPDFAPRGVHRHLRQTLAVASTVDIPRSILNFPGSSRTLNHPVLSEAHATDGVALNYTLRSPWASSGCISPWNCTPLSPAWKLAPARSHGQLRSSSSPPKSRP